MNQHKISVSPNKSPRKRSPMKRRAKPRRGNNVNASQIMETNEDNYTSTAEVAGGALQEPHPEPSGDDICSERYEDESSDGMSRQSHSRTGSRLTNRLNSGVNSRLSRGGSRQIIDDDSAFDR